MDREIRPAKSELGLAILEGACNVEKTKDFAVDLSDKFIDSILEGGVLEEIPILKSVIAVKNAWSSIHDRLFLKKVCRFILACPRICDAEREAFAAENLCDPKKADRLSQTIVLVLDRLDDLEKPKMLAKVFSEFLRGKFGLEAFRRLATAIDIGFLEDLQSFAEISDYEREELAPLYLSLVRTGLTEFKGPKPTPKAGGQNPLRRINCNASELGKLFAACMRDEL